MRNRSKFLTIVPAILLAIVAGCADNAAQPKVPKGGMDGAMDKGKMDGGMDKGKMDGAMDKGKMDGAMDKGKMDAPPK